MMDAPSSLPDPPDNPEAILAHMEQRAAGLSERERRVAEVNLAIQVIGLYAQRGTTALVREVPLTDAWSRTERACYEAALRLMTRVFMEGA